MLCICVCVWVTCTIDTVSLSPISCVLDILFVHLTVEKSHRSLTWPILINVYSCAAHLSPLTACQRWPSHCCVWNHTQFQLLKTVFTIYFFMKLIYILFSQNDHEFTKQNLKKKSCFENSFEDFIYIKEVPLKHNIVHGTFRKACVCIVLCVYAWFFLVSSHFLRWVHWLQFFNISIDIYIIY